MIDFLTNNSIYVVLVISLIIWAGIAIFLFNIDKKLKVLEKKVLSTNNKE